MPRGILSTIHADGQKRGNEDHDLERDARKRQFQSFLHKSETGSPAARGKTQTLLLARSVL